MRRRAYGRSLTSALCERMLAILAVGLLPIVTGLCDLKAQPGPAAAGEIISVEVTLSEKEDAVEEWEDGDVKFVKNDGEEDLDLGKDNYKHIVGIRFVKVPIPRNAVIVNSYIQFRSNHNSSPGGESRIEFENVGDASAFEEKKRSLSTRRRNVVKEIVWTTKEGWRYNDAGPFQQTPSLNDALQYIVRKGEWQSGNSLAVFIRGDNDHDAWPYGENFSRAPTLHVEYTTEYPMPSANVKLVAGAGVRDITPPPGMGVLGYSKDAKFGLTTGVRTRLKARALYLRNASNEKVVLVQTDLGAVSMLLWDEVYKEVGPMGLQPSQLLISATHTHGGPSGYFWSLVYNRYGRSDFGFVDLFKTGFDLRTLRFLSQQVARAIRQAITTAGPAKLAVGQLDVRGFTVNRSLDAHNSNKPKPKEPIDPAMTVLRVDRALGKNKGPLAVYSNFAVHGTAVPLETTLWNGDVQAAMARDLERRVRSTGVAGFVHLVTNANEGDIKAKFDKEIRKRDHFAEAHRIGAVLAGKIYGKFNELKKDLSDSVTIATALREFDTATADPRDPKNSPCGKRVFGGRDRPAYGVATLAGSEEGPSTLRGKYGIDEGTPRDKPLGCQGYKAYPLSWKPIDKFLGFALSAVLLDGKQYPQWLSLHAVRIGSLLLAAIPGEATAEMGRRIKKSALEAAQAHDKGVDKVALVGLSNQFVSYITTKEEYAKQHYEGGSTIYGPNSGKYIRTNMASVAEETTKYGGNRYERADRDLRPPRDDGRWPKEDSALERSVSSKTPTFDKAKPTVTFTWQDVSGLSSIELHRSLVKIQRKNKSGKYEDYSLPDGSPQDDQGLNIEIVFGKKTKNKRQRNWHARWYYSGADKDPNARYRFVVAPRSYYADELTSDGFALR